MERKITIPGGLPIRFLVFIILFSAPHLKLPSCLSQEIGSAVIDSSSAEVNNHSSIPNADAVMIQLLDFKNTDLKDIVRSLATKYNLNIFVDDQIQRRVTLHLTNVTAAQVLEFIVKEYELEMTTVGNIYKITQPEIPVPQPQPLSVSFSNGLLTVDLQDEDIADVVRAVAEITQKNIVLNQGTSGKISGFLQDVPFEQGIKMLMSSNGFILRRKNNIYIISRNNEYSQNTDGQPGSTYWVDVKDSLVTLEVSNADLSRIIRDVSSRLEKDVFVYGTITGKVTARCSGITFDGILDYLFKGTNYTYRRQNSIYFIGDKNVSGIASSKLIRLNHIKAEGIIDVLPNSIVSKATLKVIKEQNALMVVGAQDVIREAEDFVRQIDHPIAQILIEAVVVDYSSTDVGAIGLTMGMQAPGDSSTGYNSFFPDIDVSATGDFINKAAKFYAPQFGIKKIGKLPDDFYIRLRAMERTGKANVRSQPQIATLNGHPASIKIGTTQYYILESERPIVGGNQAFNQISQRFEKVTAEISLKIVPWVSASGEITTEIHPEFSTPQGSFEAGVPPTINHRILDSTVRLRDGETIVLGGLIQTMDNETYDKLPLLGDIPVLGRLFQNRSHNKSKAELIIYITPHLYYSDSVNPSNQGIIR